MSVCSKSFRDKTNPNVRERTHQSFAKECDINNIMSKYRKTGYFVDAAKPNPHRLPNFGDFSGVGDFQSVMNTVVEAQNAFMRLPAAVRSRFSNNVADAVVFVSDPVNLEESVKLGLLPADAPEYVALMKKRADDAAIAEKALAVQRAAEGAVN